MEAEGAGVSPHRSVALPSWVSFDAHGSRSLVRGHRVL